MAVAVPIPIPPFVLPVPAAWAGAVAALPVSVVVLGLVVVAGAVWGAVGGSKTDTDEEQLRSEEAASHGGSKAKKLRRSRRISLRQRNGRHSRRRL